MSAVNEVRFRDLFACLGGNASSAPYVQLLEAYSQPLRAYHNVTHLEDCLRQLDGALSEAQRPNVVEAALWFHDAVYDPKASDNEEQSAAWARTSLLDAGVAEEAVRRIGAMILATKHNGEPDSSDAALMLDIDLSILGREPNVFEQYDRAIREEYAWVPEEQYRAARAAILERFLARPAIYGTGTFFRRFENQARVNLEETIRKLRGS